MRTLQNKATMLLIMLTAGLLGFNSFTKAAPSIKTCEENFSPSGFFMGCTLKKGDRILNSMWVSPVFNEYSGNIHQGVSWFRIDKDGNYEGHTIIRPANQECVKLNPKGWTGKIYKIADNTYAAWNDGAEEGFYLINMGANGTVGSSLLMGGKGLKNVTEKNEFYRKPLNYDIDALIRVTTQFEKCP